MDTSSYDTDPWVINAGETSTVAWMVDVDDAPIDTPWQARGQVRATVGSGTALETFVPTISDGVVSYTFTAAATTAMTWASGILGVEVYDDSSPERVFRVVQAPITVSPEVVR